MTYRKRLTTAERRAIYKEACGAADFPNCNLCGLPVFIGQKWEVSHVGVPAAHDGKEVGVAHKRCNREHGAKVVTPMVAETKREYDRHRDIWRSRNPMSGGADDPRKRTMDGRVVDRITGQPWRWPR